MNELFVEVALRAAKLVLAALVGVVIYVIMAGPLGVPGSPQLALESWIAGALVLLLFETSAF
jgi:hypothetical protein